MCPRLSSVASHETVAEAGATRDFPTVALVNLRNSLSRTSSLTALLHVYYTCCFMQRKLTITIDEAVYRGLYKKVGPRKIARFIEEIVRPACGRRRSRFGLPRRWPTTRRESGTLRSGRRHYWTTWRLGRRAVMNRGEVWWVSFESARGGEVRKRRPAIIVSNDASNRHLNRVQVVPLTSATRRVYPSEGTGTCWQPTTEGHGRSDHDRYQAPADRAAWHPERRGDGTPSNVPCESSSDSRKAGTTGNDPTDRDSGRKGPWHARLCGRLGERYAVTANQRKRRRWPRAGRIDNRARVFA